MIFKKSMSAVIPFLFVASCGTSDFKAGVDTKKILPPAKVDSSNQKPKPVPGKPSTTPITPVDTTIDANVASFPNIIYVDKSRNGKIADPFVLKAGTLAIKVDKSLMDTENVVTKKPVSIYFVIDHSTSMTKQIASIRNSIQSFSDRMQTSGFDVRFGALTFEDKADFTLKLGDFDAFQDFAAGLNITSGSINYDLPEGALGAVLTAAKNVINDETRPNAEPVVVLITDAKGHKGGSGASGTARDCAITDVTTYLNSATGKNVKFFYSANTVQQTDTCGSGKINAQYDAILSSITTASNQAFRGQQLSWPFNDEVLAKQLPKLLEENITKELSCSATEVSLFDGKTELGSYRGEALSDVGSGVIQLGKVFSAKELASMVGKPLTLNVTRCCDASITASCANQKTQTAEIELRLP